MSMKQYLVASSDESVTAVPLMQAAAESPEAVLLLYRRRVLAKDSIFRRSVLDRGVNDSFAERFYLSSNQE